MPWPASICAWQCNGRCHATWARSAVVGKSPSIGRGGAAGGAARGHPARSRYYRRRIEREAAYQVNSGRLRQPVLGIVGVDVALVGFRPPPNRERGDQRHTIPAPSRPPRRAGHGSATSVRPRAGRREARWASRSALCSWAVPLLLLLSSEWTWSGGRTATRRMAGCTAAAKAYTRGLNR